MRSLLYAPDPSLKPSGSTAIRADSTDPSAPTAPVNTQMDEKDQEYDHFVRELAFEKRAKPKDRTKTEEELALEEKDILEKAEKKRLRRMQGLEEESDDDGEGDQRRKRQRGGDDLEDDFMDDEDNLGGLGAGLDDDILQKRQSDEGSDESDEEQGSDSEEDDTDVDEDEEGDDGGMASEYSESEGEDQGEEGPSEELVKTRKASSKQKGKASSGKEELPYTFACPATHDEFLEIVDDIDDTDVSTVVKRIRTLHHPSLAQDNKFKLQVKFSSSCEDYNY